MAKKTKKPIMLYCKDSGYHYTIMESTKNPDKKFSLKKYDPVSRQHKVFTRKTIVYKQK